MLQKEAVIRKREVEVGEEEKEARIAQMKDWQRYTHIVATSEVPTSETKTKANEVCKYFP